MRESLVDRHSVERLLLLAGALLSGTVDALASDQWLSAGQVAGLAGTDVRATGIVLEALAAEQIVERLQGGDADALYRLSAEAKAHLAGEGPGSERFGILHQVNKVRGWLELPEVIRTGKAPDRRGAKRDVRLMVSAMGERDPEVLDEILERCFAYAGAIRTMADMGGAVGHLARHFSRKGVKATLFDREEVLPVAREFLGAEAGEMSLIGGDLTVALPSGPFDLVYFGNVLHIYSPDTCSRVAREAFSVTSPGGIIAIQDYILDRSAGAAMFAVNMLRSTDEGGVWSEAQHRQWLADAGYEDVEVFDLASNRTGLILGRRPVAPAG